MASSICKWKNGAKESCVTRFATWSLPSNIFEAHSKIPHSHVQHSRCTIATSRDTQKSPPWHTSPSSHSSEVRVFLYYALGTPLSNQRFFFFRRKDFFKLCSTLPFDPIFTFHPAKVCLNDSINNTHVRICNSFALATFAFHT